MSRIDPMVPPTPQAMLDAHLETIRSINFGNGVKWPRFKLEEPGRPAYGFGLIDDDQELPTPSQHKDGAFLIGSMADVNGSRRLVIIRSQRDQGAVLDTRVLLTEVENKQIDDYLIQTDSVPTPTPTPTPTPANLVAIQKMLIQKSIGFSDNSILKLRTPEGGIRYSLKAGKKENIGVGSFSVVKNELACAQFNAQGERMVLQNKGYVIRAAVECKEEPFVDELNLYDASASDCAQKIKYPREEVLANKRIETHKKPTHYTVQRKAISLKDFITACVTEYRVKNPVTSGVPNPFQFPALPASTTEEIKVLFECAIGIVNAVRQLHKLGIAHRDIKPDNFLRTTQNIKPDEERHVVTLGDFGLSTDCRTSGLDAIPEGNLCGTPIYIYNFLATTSPLRYREADTIALLRTLFIDDQSAILRLDQNNKPFTKKVTEMSDETKKNMFYKFLIVCLFPRGFVDTRPSLSLILRSVQAAIAAPYDIDTILCALLLEQHDHLAQYCNSDKCQISKECMNTILTKFDQNPDVNPLDDVGFSQKLFSEDNVKKQDAGVVLGALGKVDFFQPPAASVDLPDAAAAKPALV